MVFTILQNQDFHHDCLSEAKHNFIQLLSENRCDSGTLQQLEKDQNKPTIPVTQNEITEIMALQIVRGIFAMVSCKQCPVVVDETANFPNKKQLTLFKPSWVMTEGSYRIHNITQ